MTKKSDDAIVMINIDPAGEDLVNHYRQVLSESKVCLELATSSQNQVERVSKINARILKNCDEMLKENKRLLIGLQKMFNDANEMAQFANLFISSFDYDRLTHEQRLLYDQLRTYIDSFS